MIHETVVTTLCPDGSVHIAPMGVQEQEGHVVLAPFRPSTTLENLRLRGLAVINYCDDVRVFAGCLTGRRCWPTVPADRIEGAVLQGALAHTELRVERFEDDPVRPRFFCCAVTEVTHAAFRGFNRGQAAVIEAAILVSRLHMLPAAKIDREIEYLGIAIDKTAGPKEREAWAWLLERIQAYRRDARGQAD